MALALAQDQFCEDAADYLSQPMGSRIAVRTSHRLACCQAVEELLLGPKQIHECHQALLASALEQERWQSASGKTYGWYVCPLLSRFILFCSANRIRSSVVAFEDKILNTPEGLVHIRLMQRLELTACDSKKAHVAVLLNGRTWPAIYRNC